MFRERALLVPQYVADEEMKKAGYHDMLKDEIRQFVSMSSYRTLEDMITRARELNKLTVKNYYSLPRIDDLFNQL